jgi:uncharacterized DUF497 family protein
MFESIRAGEKRFQMIGIAHGVVLFLVYTSRGKKKRIISVMFNYIKNIKFLVLIGKFV